MVRRFFGGRKIKGLATDAKPTAPEDDAEFYETDTKKTFDWSGSAWAERATASEGEAGGQLNLPYNSTLTDYNTHTTTTASSEGLGDSETNTWGETAEVTFTLGMRNYSYHACGSYQVDGGNPVDATNVVVQSRCYGYISNWAYLKIDEVTSTGTTTVGESGQFNGAGTYTLNRGTINDLIGYNFYCRCAGTNNSNPVFNIYARGKSLNADFATTKLKTYSTDSDDATWWQSNQETNPYLTVDTGSSNRIDSVMIKPKDVTTETEIAIQTSPDNSTWTTKRIITTSNLTNGSYNYIRINPTVARYVRIYGNSGISKKLALSEMRVKNGMSDNDFLLAHGHGTISETDTSIGLDGT